MKRNLLITGLLITSGVFSQEVNKIIQAGNSFYGQKQYERAEQEYKSALKSQPFNTTARFNLGNAILKTGRQGDAMRTFEAVATDSRDASFKSKAHYNKGVILTQQKRLEESIESYKNALRNDPNDREARENLQKALLELKKKQPKKQDQQQKKQEQKKQERPKMNKKEAEQRLKLLEQKEKEVQERLQKEKSKAGGSQMKDW